MSYSLEEINQLSPEDFVRTVGPIFEHSPWIAGRGEGMRPLASREKLHEALCDIVRNATAEEQLKLIRAHPDLVGRVVLTAESKGEQSAAGLTNLTADEVAAFDRYNREYQEKFGFPFVICARQNKKDAILAAFPVRLANDGATEQRTALGEIFQIALLRIQDLINP